MIAEHGATAHMITVRQLSEMIVPQRNPNLVLLTILPNPAASDFLIEGTLSAQEEVDTVRRLAVSMVGKCTAYIVLYGSSEEDADALWRKCRKLRELGFEHVHIFLGGLFRWLCMRFFYRAEYFPCTYSARAIQEIGLPPPPPAVPTADSEGAASASEEARMLENVRRDAYFRIIGIRMSQG